MRYALMTEPQQGYSYQDILDAANAAKAAGFDTYFRSDYYSSFPGEEGLPATDCWTTLAGLAREPSSINSMAREALLDGRFSASCDDIRAVAPACLRHRLMLSYEANAAGMSSHQLVSEIVKLVAVA